MEGTPKRSFMSDSDIKWRHGKAPDYTAVNNKFMAERTVHHAPGSLEETVENLVKTWEMECSHKSDPKQWQCMDIDNYKVGVNGMRTFDLDTAAELGTYNLLMRDTPFYDAKNKTFASSHALFMNTFGGSFPWELLEVFSGPPKVAFSWRHWGKWVGEYEGMAPSGETIVLTGMTIATVTDDLKIQRVETYYDPNPFLLKFLGKKGIQGVKCPFQHE